MNIYYHLKIGSVEFYYLYLGYKRGSLNYGKIIKVISGTFEVNDIRHWNGDFSTRVTDSNTLLQLNKLVIFQ